MTINIKEALTDYYKELKYTEADVKKAVEMHVQRSKSKESLVNNIENSA